MRLSMNLLVKNESDIIGDNIRFHAAQGVDCFVVMDNGSTDGTREIVEKLKSEYEIHIIDRPVLDYQQSRWKTEMAHYSRRNLGAAWSIANDADEFWVSDSGNIKSDLTWSGSVVYCKRVNMIPDYRFGQDCFSYLDSAYRVKSPVLNKGGRIIEDDSFAVSLGNINGKVIVNNYGILRVKGGNHRAWHLWSFLNYASSKSITVYHFPIRSRSGFIANIENRAKLLERGVTRMGDHYRRWVRLYNEGKLDQEIDRIALSPQDAETLLKFGIIEDASEVSERLRSVLVC